jgi:hypothetical protein
MESFKPVVDELEVSPEFSKLMDDIIVDLLVTFPEYKGIIQRWDTKYPEKSKRDLYLLKHCINVLPERFFDILYKNQEIFEESSTINTEFLPGIVFKNLWGFDISQKTKETLLNYLQLIVFSIMDSVKSMKNFGDTAKMFEQIDENELKAKLSETLDSLKSVFEKKESMNTTDFPDVDEIHNHLQGMMSGKLGKLAMELAEETAKDLEVDIQDASSSQEVFQKLMNNPSKLMNMVKNVGGKIDSKLKSGELNEKELMSEGMDLLNKMKGMPGMENMQEMLSKMGLGKGVKINTAAMQSKMDQMSKMEKMKERMKKKMELKKIEKEIQLKNQEEATKELIENPMTETELISMFEKENTKTSKKNNKKKNKIKI